MEKKKLFTRLLVFLLMQVVLIALCLNSYIIEDTKSRYIKQHADQVHATYTALFFDSNIKTATVALENNVAFINFDLMNFIDDDVTKRDIEYFIKEPTTYYDNKAEEITPNGSNNIYVLDEWKKPVEVQKDTYKYDTEIIENTGEVVLDNNGNKKGYKFTYEPLNPTPDSDGLVTDERGIGKTHNVTVKIERKDSSVFSSEENISIVVQLTAPYAEVLIINLTVLDKMITFSSVESVMYETPIEKLNIQSVNSYSHYYVKGNNGTWSYQPRQTPIKTGDNANTFFTAHGFKVKVKFTNLIIDDNSLNHLHIPEDGINSSDIDITKPYVIDVSSNGKSGGELVLYVPQASSFDINFIISGQNYSIDVFVEAYIYYKTSDTYKYMVYNTDLGGYNHSSTSLYNVLTGGGDN